MKTTKSDDPAVRAITAIDKILRYLKRKERKEQKAEMDQLLHAAAFKEALDKATK